MNPATAVDLQVKEPGGDEARGKFPRPRRFGGFDRLNAAAVPGQPDPLVGTIIAGNQRLHPHPPGVPDLFFVAIRAVAAHNRIMPPGPPSYPTGNLNACVNDSGCL